MTRQSQLLSDPCLFVLYYVYARLVVIVVAELNSNRRTTFHVSHRVVRHHPHSFLDVSFFIDCVPVTDDDERQKIETFNLRMPSYVSILTQQKEQLPT